MPGTKLPQATRDAFARRIDLAIKTLGINQSELARRAELPRDAISTYMRAKSFPTNENLVKLAKALGMTVTELSGLPDPMSRGEAKPALAIKVSSSNPNLAWIGLNRLVSFATAVEIAKILEADKTATTQTA